MLDQDLISGLLELPSEIETVRGKIQIDDLTDKNAKIVYQAMLTFEKFDSVIVGNYLREKNEKKALEWMHSITGTGFGSSIDRYAKEIKRASIKRQQVKIAEDLIGMSKTDVKPNEIIELFSGRLMSLYEDDEDQLFDFKKLVMDYLEMMDKKVKGATLSGMATGWKSIDDITDGLGESELILIGARPSMGKTSMMTQIMYHALTHGKVVLAFSVESNRNKIIEKMISQASDLDAVKFKRNSLSQDEKDTSMYYFNKMTDGQLFLNDSTGMSIYKMRSLIRQKINEGIKPDLVCVDHIQIMQTDKSNDTMAVRVGRVCQGLKNIAKELGCPVVALAQLNRDVETNPPTLHSLKASGDMEQIADQVWLLHRQNFYSKDKEKNPDNEIVVDIAKNREGGTDAIKLKWVGRYTQIKE